MVSRKTAHTNGYLRSRDALYDAKVLSDPAELRRWHEYVDELAACPSESPLLILRKDFHDLIPPLSDDEYRQLEANLKAEGCRDALVVWPKDGQLILVDGHNRYRICRREGIAYRVMERAFEDEYAAKEWIIRNQFGRRNIGNYLRAALALELEAAIAEQARTRMLSGKKQDPTQNSAQGETREELAGIAGVSHDTVSKVKAIKKQAPERIQQAARNGDLSVNRAYELTRTLSSAAPVIRAAAEELELDDPKVITAWQAAHEQNPAFVEETLTRGHITNLDGEDIPLAQADATLIEAISTEDTYERLKRQKVHVEESLTRKAEREAQRRALAARTPPPQGQYRCLVVDAPWPLEKIEREVRPNQGALLDYPTMTLPEIAALPVPSLAAEDGCHLYLWSTQKYLPDALKLMESWGFRYQCLFTWVKPTGMTPYSWMYNTELVLFGRRGNLELTQLGLKLSFEAPSAGHSVKPDVFYQRVLAASPGPRLEMFARRERDGFAVWGNEVAGCE